MKRESYDIHNKMSEANKANMVEKPKNGKKGLLASILIVCALSAACIVFEVLCLKYFKNGFIARNIGWLLWTVCGVTVAYFAASVTFLSKGKNVIFRVLFSGYILILFFLILLFILQKTGFFEVIRDAEKFEAYLESVGIWMPFLYVVLQYLQVVILPIPAFMSTVAGVALFGPLKAMLFSLIGIISGSLTAFIIGRKIGYKAVAWMVGKEDLDKWLKKVKGKDNFILTAMFVLPLFPDDMLCFVAGLSSMTWQYFIAMILIARVLGIAGTCYSVNFIPFNTWWGILIWVVLIAAIIVAFVFLYKYMDEINSWFNKKFSFSRKRKNKKRGTSDKK